MTHLTVQIAKKKTIKDYKDQARQIRITGWASAWIKYYMIKLAVRDIGRTILSPVIKESGQHFILTAVSDCAPSHITGISSR